MDALPAERRFRRLIRNMRNASDLFGRLVGCGTLHRGGHTYRLVPAKAFDNVLALLRRVGEVDGVTSEKRGAAR